MKLVMCNMICSGNVTGLSMDGLGHRSSDVALFRASSGSGKSLFFSSNWRDWKLLDLAFSARSKSMQLASCMVTNHF